MLEGVGGIMGLGVYTPGGIYVGNVDNVVMDVENTRIDGLFIEHSNPALVEKGVSVNVPYRWVKAIGDIVILKVFPEKVTIGPQ